MAAQGKIHTPLDDGLTEVVGGMKAEEILEASEVVVYIKRMDLQRTMAKEAGPL